MRVSLLVLGFLISAAAFASSIDGKWNLVARKCANTSNWEGFAGTVTYLNSQANSYELEMISNSCVLRKIGVLKVQGASLSFCDVKGSATGKNCPQNILDHVKLVNSNEGVDLCSSRSFSLSGDGQSLQFSEATTKTGFA